MKTDTLINQWACATSSSVKGKAGNLRTEHHELWSYALKIAQRVNDGRIALVLPYGVSTPTTNRHLEAAAYAASTALGVQHVFRVPVIAPAAVENIEYFHAERNAALKQVLNKRCGYYTRAQACKHYYDCLREICHYWETFYLGSEIADLHLPNLSIIDQLEEAGDMKFIGQLGLEGDARGLHTLHEEYLHD